MLNAYPLYASRLGHTGQIITINDNTYFWQSPPQFPLLSQSLVAVYPLLPKSAIGRKSSLTRCFILSYKLAADADKTVLWLFRKSFF